MKESDIRNVTTESVGPASWQQLVRLRDEQRYGYFDGIWNVFAIPAELTEATVRQRIADIVQREAALRIVNATLTADSAGQVRYAERPSYPIETVPCDSRASAVELANKSAEPRFDRNGSPLWRIGLYSYPDQHGTSLICATVFEHFVSDGRSLYLLQGELTDTTTSAPTRRAGYRDWVVDQLRRFPASAQADTPARRFWRGHLDGTAADRPSPLPFSMVPDPGHRPRISTVDLVIPAAMPAMRSAAARLRVTPFLLALASLAATAAEAGTTDDLTLRVITNGRPANHLHTQGWFADSLPIRLRHHRLASFDAALEATVSAWSQMIEYHDTPLAYIQTVSCPEQPASPERPALQQVVLNFVPHDFGDLHPEGPAERTVDGFIDGLHLIVLANSTGRSRLTALFDPGCFATPAVLEFLRRFIERLSEAITGSEPA